MPTITLPLLIAKNSSSLSFTVHDDLMLYSLAYHVNRYLSAQVYKLTHQMSKVYTFTIKKIVFHYFCTVMSVKKKSKLLVYAGLILTGVILSIGIVLLAAYAAYSFR
jgi:ABC-type polysaccharide/polyol phosphate export permease